MIRPWMAANDMWHARGSLLRQEEMSDLYPELGIRFTDVSDISKVNTLVGLWADGMVCRTEDSRKFASH